MSTQEPRRTTRPPFWRRKRLIKPSMQLRLIVTFAALFGSVFLMQTMLMNWQLTQLDVERTETVPSSVVPQVIGYMQWIAFVVSLPVTIVAGVLITHRWAGPVYRFEQYLAAIARGEDPGPCKIRKGDEMQELCARINEAVAALRKPAPQGASAKAADAVVPAAALPTRVTITDAPIERA